MHASWGSGPGKLEQWTLLARARAMDTTGVVAAVDQAYPGDEIAAVGPTGVGGSLVAPRSARCWRRRAPTRSCWCPTSTSMRSQKARETIAVLRNRAEFAHRR